MSLAPLTVEQRALLVQVLVYHQRADSPPKVGCCACGWAVLGGSYAEHVADVYSEALAFESR